MSKISYFIGVDIAADTFTASIYQSPDKPLQTKDSIANNACGFNVFVEWLTHHGITATNSLICMEATGVYSEAIAYYLSAKGYSIAVEPPLKVKRTFDPVGHKTDSIDSKQIAEYTYRYQDELRLWQPKDEIIEKIKHLLVAREQFTKQKVTSKNALVSYERHVVQVPMIIKAHQKLIKQLQKQIADIDKELDKYIDQNPDIFRNIHILKSLVGFGTLLSSQLIVATGCFETIKNHKKLAAFIGICPYKKQSGKSLFKPDQSRQYGPSAMRKLLRLAAQSVSMHDEQYRKYYLHKIAEGKAKALVLNNIANKLVKVAFAMIKNNKCYIKNYQSIHPMYLKLA